MSTRTISSPGVQITEQDLTLTTRPLGATDILLTGFAPQGPSEDVVVISDITEFEDIYGVPTTPAERYLYHSAKQILNTSPANLQICKLPYGPDAGTGYSNQYSALVYPVTGYSETVQTLSTYKSVTTKTIVGFSLDELLASFKSLGYTDLTSTGDLLITTGQTITSSLVKTASAYSVLQSNGNTTWYLPYSTLAFDASTFVSYPSALSECNRYELQEPISILIDDTLHSNILSNNIDWKDRTAGWSVALSSSGTQYLTFSTANGLSSIKSADDFFKAGLIVINESKRSVNDGYEGYYIGMCDNININPSTDYDSVTAVYTTQSQISSINESFAKQSFLRIPESRFNFKLTQKYTEFGSNSISEKLESIPTGFDFKSDSYDDSLVIALFRLKTSIYNQDTVTLDYNIVEGYTGSICSNRTQNNPAFGLPKTSFIDTQVFNKSSNLRVITNPYISNAPNWSTSVGKPAKKIRLSSKMKSLYPSSVYIASNNNKSKDLGNIPLKLQNVLNQIQNHDSINIDVVAEAGLGTIWAGAKARRERENDTKEFIYDDTYFVDTTDLKSTTGEIVTGINSDYGSVCNKFTTFANERKDHLFIADPLRHIFIQGKDYKTVNRKGFIFSTDIYWAIRNQFAAYQSSYMATYSNWLKISDDFSNEGAWVPPSGFISAIIASTSQIHFPWTAPAGLNNGTLTNVLDIGVDATQKQSDILYKINANPISFFGTDGFAVFGQKTLFRKPSAFDRINVRRLFLTLEKQTKALLKYYVFEPNTFSTRQRLIGSLIPIFDKAKMNDGLYEYQIVCDERNNTPEVIDNNELAISIYIKPVRTAEFILADFIGTRTGVVFSELIG